MVQRWIYYGGRYGSEADMVIRHKYIFLLIKNSTCTIMNLKKEYSKPYVHSKYNSCHYFGLAVWRCVMIVSQKTEVNQR